MVTGWQEGFGYVIVGAHFQSQHLVGFFTASGEHKDGLAQFELAKLPADVEAGLIRQAHVKDNQVGVMIAGVDDTVTAVFLPDNLKVGLLKPIYQAVRYGRIVLNQQDVAITVH